MLDGFYRLHSQLVFRDQHRAPINDVAFLTARTAATKAFGLPDRAFLSQDNSYERHRQFYEFLVTWEVDAYRSLCKKLDRTLMEVVILYKLLQKEETRKGNDPTVDRSISVLGWMIQERLRFILLQTGNRSFQQIMKLREVEGIDQDVWAMRLVGAAAETKALMELSDVHGLRLYPATVFEDIELGIDFYAETPGGAGACVSVKTDVEGRTRFLRRSTPGYEQAWNRIQSGSQRFDEKACRDWRPILVLVGKPRGKDINLELEACHAQWVEDIKNLLLKEPRPGLILTA